MVVFVVEGIDDTMRGFALTYLLSLSVSVYFHPPQMEYSAAHRRVTPTASNV